MENNKVPSNAEEQSKSTAGFTFPPIHQKQLSKAFMEIKPGTKIGEFTINEKIGSGGLGDVYKAELAGTTKKFAIKIVQPDKANDALIERFNQERTTLGNLDHPNIVNITYTGNYQGLPYFAMELVDGLHITKYADKNNLTIKKRLALFLQVCEAVKYAHEQGVIHRDLKPANILVTEREQGEPLVKVIDFGIAKILDESFNSEYATQIGEPIGTPAYMSPEQTGQNPQLVDERSDIYALGVMLYELLVGSLPLNVRGNRDEKIRIITKEKPLSPSARIEVKDDHYISQIARKRGVDPTQLKSILNETLDRIVMKCLSKDQTTRFETVEALTQDIQYYLGEQKSQRPSSTEDAKDAVLTIVIALLIVIIAAVVYFKVGSSKPPKSEIAVGELSHPAAPPQPEATSRILSKEDITVPDDILVHAFNVLATDPQ